MSTGTARSLASQRARISLWWGFIWLAVLAWWLFWAGGNHSFESNLMLIVVAGTIGLPISLLGFFVIFLLDSSLPMMGPLQRGLTYWLVLAVFAWIQWAIVAPFAIRKFQEFRARRADTGKHRHRP